MRGFDSLNKKKEGSDSLNKKKEGSEKNLKLSSLTEEKKTDDKKIDIETDTELD